MSKRKSETSYEHGKEIRGASDALTVIAFDPPPKRR